MHEAHLMQGLMRRIAQIADDNDAQRVVSVSVWLGALSHFTPEHFAEHFAQAAAGTAAQGARLRATASDDIGHPDAQDVLLQSVELED